MLAELSNPVPVEMVSWLACVAFAIALINGGFKLVDRLRGQPPIPPNETLGHVCATLSGRVDRQEFELADLRRELKENQADQSRQDAQLRESLHRKIDETRVELETRMEAHRRELSQDLKDMPARIIALLKDTDAI